MGSRDTTAARLALRNGTVVTVEPGRPVAQAIAIRGDRIQAVGSDREVTACLGPRTRVLDLQGALALPGFIDCHGHLPSLGQARMHMDLRGARDWAAIVRQVAAAARQAPPGTWLPGRGWHQDRWAERPAPSVQGLPLHHRLSEAAPDHPVLLRHACGHAVLANARGMEQAGVDRRTADPEGGTIVRDAQGEPTGAFLETAADLVEAALREHLEGRSQQQKEADLRRQVDLATAQCLANGITTFHDAGTSLETLAVYRKLADEGKLGIRVYAMVSDSDDRIAEALPECRLVGYAGQRLTARAIKRLADGALGSRTAWMLAPYADRPGRRGHRVASDEALSASARFAMDNGLQLCVHAIGDGANREVLDLLERVFGAHPASRDLRWRIEHAQHLHPRDVPRFADLGLIASVQPSHCITDGAYIPDALGAERAAQAYPWRSLLEAGAAVISGSDAPVEEPDPVAGFHAAVTRRLADGSAFHPRQRMTRHQALRAYTRDAAWAAFEDRDKGSLAPGKLADLVVLDRDILTVPEDEIRAARVLYTILGGRIAYTAGEDCGAVAGVRG
ncbi:MAG: amidohydrolase [Candidatus Brocadiia bacterium]